MNKPRYYSVFQEPWWLDATAPGQWEEVSIQSGGETIARLPFTLEGQSKNRRLTQPALTQTLGPWLKDTGAGYAKALGRTNQLLAELIDALPPHDSFYQVFPPEMTNWLPFYWSGYTETTRYTYQIRLDASLDVILSEMDKRNRSQLRKAERTLAAQVEDDLETFLALNRSTFERQGRAVPYSDEFVNQIDEAVVKNASRSIVIARDQSTGVPHAGIYMVHYGNVTHSLMSGVDEALRDQNGMIIARWKAIEIARGRSSILDLQGSMMKSIERRNRNYGAHQVPIMAVSKRGPYALRADKVQLSKRRLRGAWSGLKSRAGALSR